MLNAGVLSFQEFMVREPLPLAVLHEAVLAYVRDRDDAVVFGAHAVNAYVAEPRMTQDVDLLSTHAEGLAQALRDHLHDRFQIAVRVRDLGPGRASGCSRSARQATATWSTSGPLTPCQPSAAWTVFRSSHPRTSSP